jgi:tetratricopeptide (TPR) repeat protein
MTDSSFEVMAQKPVDVSFSVGSTVSADSFGLPVDALSSSDETKSVDPFVEGVHRQSSLRRPRQFRNFRDELEYLNFENDGKLGNNQETLVESTQEDEDDNGADQSDPHDSPKAMPSPPCSPLNSVGDLPIMAVEVSTLGLLRDEVFVPFEDENNENEGHRHVSLAKPSHRQRAKLERRYWSSMVTSRIATLGHFHLKTVDALMHLGSAQLQCREYQEAMTTFKVAHRIQRKLVGNTDRHVAIARILDRIGLAACKASAKSKDELQTARSTLHQAFLLRYELLGAWHVDTVESLNNLARVQMLLSHYHEARKSYYEVLRVRKAIFGPDHPSVAVTAHSLAKACTRLNQLEESYTYFQLAMDIYKRMDMPKENPTFASLVQDVNRLERVMPGIGSR